MSLMSAVVVVSVLAAGSWMIDAIWNDPDNLQFLIPLLLTIYSLAVVVPLAAVVLLTRGMRASSSTAERWINLAVVVAAAAGSAVWAFALIDQARYLVDRA